MSSSSRSRVSFVRRSAVLVVLAMLAVACGQKEGVHIAGSQDTGRGAQGGSTTDGSTADGSTTGTTADDSTTTTGDSTTTTGTQSTTGGSTSTGGSTTGGSTSTGGGSTSTGGGSTSTGGTTGGDTSDGGTTTTDGGTSGGTQVQGSDETGVTPEEIVIGLHAPVTGAAPVPAEEFRDNQNLYWDYWKSKGRTFNGRNVRVLFEDDKYNPGDAKQKCSQLVAHSFLLIGGAGTDQIKACGELANRREVPYFSAGVTEAGLKGLPWYFAASMSYAAQADLLAQYILKTFGNKKTAMVVTNTPNFEDAWTSFEAAAERHGLDYYRTLKHEKDDGTWYSNFALELDGEGVEIVYPLTAPTEWIQFAGQAQNQGYNPQWAGVGITMGLNKILGVACRNAGQNVDGAQFFSPYPQLDVIDQLDPEFRQAAQELGVDVTDIGLTLWGINKTMAQFLDRYAEHFGEGSKMTREQFRAFTEQQQGISTNVFPGLSYTPNDHFGANQVHVIEADCSDAMYDTVATFKSSF